MINKLIIYSNLKIFLWAIPGGNTTGGTVPGEAQIPPGIVGNLFHFEMELFHFKMEWFHFNFNFFILLFFKK